MAILKIRNTANTAWLNVGNSVNNAIQDTDGDTLVTTQRGDDDDTIRFDAGGSQDVITVTSSVIAGSLIADEDDMASDDAGLICTQQSIKAYSDSLGWMYFGGAALAGDTQWTLEVWDTTYVAFRIVFSDVKPSSANCPLIVQLQYNDTTWVVSGYTGAGQLMNAGGTAMTTGFMAITAAYHDAAGSGFGIYEIYKNVSTQGRIHFQGSYGVTTGATQYQGRGTGYVNAGATSITGLRIRPYTAGSTWTAGVAYMWAGRKALY
jgi:hypothetical protein